MFESVTLGRSISKQEFAKLEPDLRVKLFDAQRDLIKHKIPAIIIISGLDGAGRGETVNMLSEWMDAKTLRNHTFWLETDEERMRPYAWRFWRKLPKAGEIGIFFGGWYGSFIRENACGDVSDEDFRKRMHQWVRLEKMLTDAGTLIVKFWLHTDKKTYKTKLEAKLANDDMRSFTPYDKKAAKNYDGMVKAASEAITITDRVNAQWTLVDAADANFRKVTVAETLIAAIANAVAAKSAKKETEESYTTSIPRSSVSFFDKIDLKQTISHDKYSAELEKLKSDIGKLTYEAYTKGISSTVIFEGWDAAGKGGAIRRLTGSIDARITQVIPIAAPTDEELAHHYLWRFWRNLPMAGFVTVYDRSWYGRVLVERVEKLTQHHEWARAYAEINDFEGQLTENNNILMKFWLHISADEQLRRFKEREETPWKNYKITPDDWRNRERHDDYVVAAEEMFVRTSTAHAPWHVIAAEDKKFARIEILKKYVHALKNALGK